MKEVSYLYCSATATLKLTISALLPEFLVTLTRSSKKVFY